MLFCSFNTFVSGCLLLLPICTGIDNEPPFVKFEFEDKQYDVGEEVLFDGSFSEDPEGDKLVFKWYFGDGEKSNEKTPIHSFNETGAYNVTLIVADSLNQLQEISKMIQVGTPPTVKIISPAEGDQFYVGQLLRLKGEASYANGTAVDDSKLQWEVRKRHRDHFHPFLDSAYGNNFDLIAAPEPEDIYASLSSYLLVSLRVTDENGIFAEINQIVEPTLVMVNITSNIPGSRIRIADEPIIMPEEVWGWKEQELHLQAENTPPFVFESWSDGVRHRERFTTLNFNTPSLEARFCVDDGGKCFIGSQTCCIGECNANRICSVAVKLPPLYLDTTLPPTMAKPVTPAPAPIQLPSLKMSSSGKAMLSITCILIAGIIVSFFYWWKCRGNISQATNPRPALGNGNNSREDNASLKDYGQEAIVNSVTGSTSSDDATATV